MDNHKKTLTITLNFTVKWKRFFCSFLIFLILELCYYFLAMEERAALRAERRRILTERKQKQEEEKLVINQECKLRQEKGFV